MNYWHEVDLAPWFRRQERGDRFLPWRAYLRLLAEADLAYPEGHTFIGRGIVIPAGGSLLPGAYVTLRLLRTFGCSLPVEIWHLGPEELPDAWQPILADLGAKTVDAYTVGPRRNLTGWQLKPYAMLFSRFEEVLLLDADNHPVNDPAFLFDDPLYRSTGALFWPDRVRHGPESALWQIFGVPYRDEPQHETGQIVWNKRRCWKALQIAMHCNEHSGFYYRHSHGDTALFRFPLHLLGQPFSVIPHRLLEVPVDRPVEDLKTLESTPYLRQAGDVRAMFLQRAPDGAVLFQHRSAGGGAQARFRLTENARIQHFEHEDLCLGFLNDLQSELAGADLWTTVCSTWPERISRRRRDGLKVLCGLLSARRARTVVETGTLRQPGNWEMDGGLTFWLALHAHRAGGTLHTVDIDPHAVAAARSVCGLFGRAVEYACGDSVAFLAAFGNPIDCLVLDSLDFDKDSDASQRHNLAELHAALPWLHADSLVAIDDCGLERGGKGGLTVPWMLEHGWSLAHDGYMKILTRQAGPAA